MADSKPEKKLTIWLTIIVLALSLLGSVVTLTSYSTRIDERSRRNQESIRTMQKVDVAHWKALQDNKDGLREIQINLKTLMHANHLEYQKAE